MFDGIHEDVGDHDIKNMITAYESFEAHVERGIAPSGSGTFDCHGVAASGRIMPGNRGGLQHEVPTYGLEVTKFAAKPTVHSVINEGEIMGVVDDLLHVAIDVAHPVFVPISHGRHHDSYLFTNNNHQATWPSTAPIPVALPHSKVWAGIGPGPDNCPHLRIDLVDRG